MVKAVDGLKIELGNVSRSFIILMVFFAMSTVLSFWVCMDTIAAIVSTIAFGLAARCWVHFSLRIIRRFHWESKELYSKSSKEGTADSDDPSIKLGVQLLHMGAKQTESSSTDPIMEGYLGVCGYFPPHGKVVWARKYVIMTGSGHLAFFEDRKSFRQNSDLQNLATRPLRMSSFYAQRNKDASTTDATLQIILCPREDDSFKHWALLCDNDEELQMWKLVLDAAMDH